jgi:hypothetical protein
MHQSIYGSLYQNQTVVWMMMTVKRVTVQIKVFWSTDENWHVGYQHKTTEEFTNIQATESHHLNPTTNLLRICLTNNLNGNQTPWWHTTTVCRMIIIKNQNPCLVEDLFACSETSFYGVHRKHLTAKDGTTKNLHRTPPMWLDTRVQPDVRISWMLWTRRYSLK